MNRTQLIVRIIERLYDKSDHADLKQILEEELPDFSRIDEERMMKLYEETYTKDWDCSTVKLMMEKYNSTLPPALQPLPKEMPKDLTRFAMGHDVDEVWDKIISEYGTPANNLQPLPKATPYEFVGLFNESHSPRKIWEWLLSHYGTHEPKPNLPSVEELARELNRVYWGSDKGMTSLAQHLHDKYSLPTREWWQELNRGDQFIYKCGDGTPKRVGEGLGIQADDGKIYHVDNCYPYTTPSAQDIIAKHNLSEEEIRAIREGKCT